MIRMKNLVIAVLATFCLTSIMFMITPIKSANSPYDPLLDYNHDGTIGLQDLVKLANSYGTSGDPTSNVNVTNWSDAYFVYQLSVVNESAPSGITSTQVYVGGFSHFTVYANVISYSPSNAIFNISLDYLFWSYSTGPGPELTETFPMGTNIVGSSKPASPPSPHY